MAYVIAGPEMLTAAATGFGNHRFERNSKGA
jgi:hypothetical protein